MAEGTGDRLKGKAKEALGKLTGDDRTKAEGKTDQVKGSAKEGASEVKESAEGVKDSLTPDSDRSESRDDSGNGEAQRE
jgi:uncharacterized protein YjbJ (UPF0337 family)